MSEKIIDVLAIACIIIFILFVGLFIYIAYDFYNDYRCSTMPIQDFFNDSRCEKYWRYRDE